MAKKDSYLTTPGVQVRNFVGWAFVISLVIHGFIAPFVPSMKHADKDQVRTVTVTHKTKIKPPPSPTPTPPPTPTPNPNTTPPPKQTKPQPVINVNHVHTTNTNNNGPTETKANNGPINETGVPKGEGTGSPSPVTPGPSAPACAVPNADATATEQVAPDYPQSAQDLNLGNVDVKVEISLDASGNVLSATIATSGNNSAIDRAAIAAAKASKYSPSIVNCVKTAGSYLFDAQFNADN